MTEHTTCAVLSSDGRQSAAVAAIARGTQRLLLNLGFATVPELTLASGRRADVVALSHRGEIWIVEIKSCLADFRADSKWPEYEAFCDRLLFAVAPGFPIEILPETTGLIFADAYGGEVLREAPSKPLAAARRKAVIQRFARAAAVRLQASADPDFVAERFE